MTENEEGKKHNIFLYSLLAGCLIAIASSFYFFYIKKDFNFIIETKCNPEIEICTYRDCTNPDDCPPNGFSYYNTYTIKANDFKACANEDCSYVCSNNIINCIKTD